MDNLMKFIITFLLAWFIAAIVVGIGKKPPYAGLDGDQYIKIKK